MSKYKAHISVGQFEFVEFDFDNMDEFPSEYLKIKQQAEKAKRAVEEDQNSQPPF